ncbi:hypothetical protein IGI58_000180 [Enterococcus sp. AZ020]
MKKVINCTSILLLMFLISLIVRTSPIVGKENYQITISEGLSSDEKEGMLTIAVPEEEKILIVFDNLECPKKEEIEGDYGEGAGQQTLQIQETEESNQLILSTKKSDAALSISWKIRQIDPNQQSQIRLIDQDNQLLVAKKIASMPIYVDDMEFPMIETVFESELIADQKQEVLTKTNVSSVGRTAGSSLTGKQQAANDAANAKVGFDPLHQIKIVHDFNEFKSAYNDGTVTKIILAADISGNSSLTARKTSIEIDGNGYTLYLGNYSLALDASGPTQAYAIFHLHDVVIDQNIESASSYSFIGGSGAYDSTRTRNWYFRIGNLSNVKGKIGINGVARVVRAYYAEVTVYGEIDLSTSAENFYVGSMIYEEDTIYKGEIRYYNYSIIWHVMETPSGKGYTGESMEHTIKKNATVYYKNQTTNHANYPAVYSNFKNFTVEEGASFSADMNGNAFALYYPGSSLLIKKDAVVSLVTQKNHAVLSYCNNDTAVNVEPGGSLFIKGNTKNSSTSGSDGNTTVYGLIDFRGRDYGQDLYRKYKDIDKKDSKRSLTLNRPKAYDFNNTLDSISGIQARVMEIPNNVGCTFELVQSDVKLWKTTSYSEQSPDNSYSNVATLSVNGRGDNEIVSSDTGLAKTFRPNNVRRITGMSVEPQIEWLANTDADDSYGLYVKSGAQFEGINEKTGKAAFSSLYADQEPAEAIFIDSYGEIVGPVKSDKDGLIGVTNSDNRLNQTNQPISATVIQGPWLIKSETTVIDITPPPPAKLENEEITNATKQLKGRGNEPNTKYFVEVYDEADRIVEKLNGVVAADGTFVADLPRYLETSESVVIYLEDNAGLAPPEVYNPPKTNSINGNKNPSEGFYYRDTYFESAARFQVKDILPDRPYLEKTAESVKPNQLIQVGDQIKYEILIKNDKPNEYQTNWKNIQLTDQLVPELDFDPDQAELMLNQILLAKESYHYDPKTRVLAVDVGDLASQASAKVSFKARVNHSAVGKIIENQAQATGDSPREKQFVSGPENPNAEHEKIVGESPIVRFPEQPIQGYLEIISFPETMDFGIHQVDDKETLVTEPVYSKDLIVQDKRDKKEEWYITVSLTEKLMLYEEKKNYYLENAIRFKNEGREAPITSEPEIIVRHKNTDSSEYNVTQSEWSDADRGFVYRLPAGKVKKAGNYRADLTWTITDAYQGGNK